MLRFSITSLIVFTVLIGIGCAALVNANTIWAQCVVTATVVCLLSLTTACFFGGSKTRVFAGGAIIFGWGYFFLATLPWMQNVKSQLLTTQLLGFAQSSLQGNAQVNEFRVSVATAVPQPAPTPLPAQSYRLTQITQPGGAVAPAVFTFNGAAPGGFQAFHFDQIGHALWTLLLAFLGGLVATAVHAWGRRKSLVSAAADQTSPSPS